MSLALARKYRPSTFDDLVGQDAVSQTLSLALDGERLSHAYLFSGLRGSGKTSTARIFAKALLCKHGPTSKPCNECDQCIMANESRHMDIIEMDAASNRGIDDIKELIEHTKYKPSIGRYKIFIIDEVHMLTNQAFNALLKTLEEPPDFVKFILATTDPLKLPATILSRTQHFRFRRIPHKLVVEHLRHILDLENIEYDMEALEIISRSGAGSLRDSLTLLDQAIVYSKNHVDVNTVTGMLGIIQPALLDRLLRDISAKDTTRILEFVSSAGEFETEMIIDELTLHLKDKLLGRDTDFAPMEIERFFRILADAKGLLSIGSDGEFVLSITLFKMIEALSVRDIDSMIHTLQKELSGISSPTIPPTTIQPQQKTDKLTASDTPDTQQASSYQNTTSHTPSHIQTINTTQEPSPTHTPSITPDNTDIQTLQPTTEADLSVPKITEGKLRFQKLISKLYDRDYDLGSCFERNIVFEDFTDGTLAWLSSAEGDDKKLLITAWSVIKMFVQEIFGLDTKIKNIPTESKKKTNPAKTKVEPRLDHVDANIPTTTSSSEEFAQSSSTLQSIELPSSPDTNPQPKNEKANNPEKDPSKLLEEPMVKEMIELFQPKKVRIVRKS